MKLYHGSLTEVKAPRIMGSDHIGDFGIGFYTTTDFQQARRFVEIKCARQQKMQGVISIFEVADDFLTKSALLTQIFSKADEAWVRFVEANRRQPGYQHEFDIVSGPVANDQVYASFALYESELIDFTELLNRLKVRKLTDQILFHTDQSLSVLKYVGSEVVTRLPKITPMNFYPDREIDRTGSLRKIPEAVSNENAPARDFRETAKGEAEVLAIVSNSMPAEITQANVRLLIPGKAAGMALLMMKNQRLSPKAALLKFYRSSTYRKLAEESTKFWHYSPEQLFSVSAFARQPDTGIKHGPGRSALSPYRTEILKAWNKRQSAQQIADWLTEQGVASTPQNVWKFIQRHSSR